MLRDCDISSVSSLIFYSDFIVYYLTFNIYNYIMINGYFTDIGEYCPALGYKKGANLIAQPWVYSAISVQLPFYYITLNILRHFQLFIAQNLIFYYLKF